MKPGFPDINKVPYEGPSSKNALAFKHYNASEVVEEMKSDASPLRAGLIGAGDPVRTPILRGMLWAARDQARMH